MGNKLDLLELDRLATATDYHDVYRKYAGIGEDYLAGTFEEWREKAKGDPVEYLIEFTSVVTDSVEYSWMLFLLRCEELYTQLCYEQSGPNMVNTSPVSTEHPLELIRSTLYREDIPMSERISHVYLLGKQWCQNQHIPIDQYRTLHEDFHSVASSCGDYLRVLGKRQPAWSPTAKGISPPQKQKLLCENGLSQSSSGSALSLPWLRARLNKLKKRLKIIYTSMLPSPN
jgi:hypothetical protein